MLQTPKLQGIDLNNEQACVFSHRGELLWQSPGWFVDGVVPKGAQRAMGFGWHEFLHEDDHDRVIEWFADGKENCITFRCMCCIGGEWAIWTQYKFEYGENWITLGEFHILATILPAPPCVFYDENEEQTG